MPLTVARVEIEPSGKIVIVTHQADGDTDQDAPDALLEAVRKKIADRRAANLARKERVGKTGS